MTGQFALFYWSNHYVSFICVHYIGKIAEGKKKMLTKRKKTMSWPEQWEIIKQKFEKIFVRQGIKYSLAQVDTYLGITRGKSRAWAKGQRPSANDLEKLATKLHLSALWLLMGEGPPEQATVAPGSTETATSISDRIVGDALLDIIQGDLDLTLEEAAAHLGISAEQLEACVGKSPAPQWDMLKRLADKLGVNINFLLIDQRPSIWPQTEIGRAMLAVGARDTWEMAAILGVGTKEIEQHLAEARRQGLTMPRQWHERLLAEYGLNPGWTMSGRFPSHIRRPAATPMSLGYPAAEIRESPLAVEGPDKKTREIKTRDKRPGKEG
ncbi:MAG: hypothetical protein PHX05_08275 [Acidobacteriota bacterium]|nr:hypothetical protein [Acidobacteriota bacterium]